MSKTPNWYAMLQNEDHARLAGELDSVLARLDALEQATSAQAPEQVPDIPSDTHGRQSNRSDASQDTVRSIRPTIRHDDRAQSCCTEHATPDPEPTEADRSYSLVERVREAIEIIGQYQHPSKRPEARAAIRAVADWLEDGAVIDAGLGRLVSNTGHPMTDNDHGRDASAKRLVAERIRAELEDR